MLGAYTYNKIIRKCVIGFGTLFNNIECRKENKDGKIIQKIKLVMLIYLRLLDVVGAPIFIFLVNSAWFGLF